MSRGPHAILGPSTPGSEHGGAADAGGAVCCLSIDVEEYFHIEAAQGTIAKGQWDDWPSHIERQMDLLLNLFDRHKRRGTFFVLGHVARKHPTLAPRLVQAGHEVASHGSMHDRLHRLTPATFREDLHAGVSLLEDQTGRPIAGYRAPTFSLTPPTAWAIEVLLAEGIRYDSSVFPVLHPQYGVPTAPDRPFVLRPAPGEPGILELPPLTWSVLGRKLAVAGGGYFRLLPLFLMKRGLAQAAQQGRPAVLYFHPWEFDPNIPRMPLPRAQRLRTYTGLASAARKLDRILARPGRWITMLELAGSIGAAPPGGEFVMPKEEGNRQ